MGVAKPLLNLYQLVSTCYEYQKMGLIKNGTTCVTKTTTHTSKNLENGRTATVQPPPRWLYLAITWPKIIPQKMLSNRNIRHERARDLLPDGFTIPWLPSCTADDFLHHEQTAGK